MKSVIPPDRKGVHHGDRADTDGLRQASVPRQAQAINDHNQRGRNVKDHTEKGSALTDEAYLLWKFGAHYRGSDTRQD